MAKIALKRSVEGKEEDVIDEGANAVEAEIRKIENDAVRDVSSKVEAKEIAPAAKEIPIDETIGNIRMRATKIRNYAGALADACEKEDIKTIKEKCSQLLSWSNSLKDEFENIK